MTNRIIFAIVLVKILVITPFGIDDWHFVYFRKSVKMQSLLISSSHEILACIYLISFIHIFLNKND